MDKIPGLGALPSKKDIRTFTHPPTKAVYVQKGGSKYLPTDIEDQSKVGICTAISLTQNARKVTGKKYSADFQYLMQKKIYDGNWYEGSSILHSLKVAKNIGLLPAEEWKHTTQEDRDGSYTNYIAKLKAIPDAEIARLSAIAAAYKIEAYASVGVDRDTLAGAITESEGGVLVRFDVGKEWWTDKKGNSTWDKDALQPLRAPKVIVSGHALIESNFDGGSFRVANMWGPEWADGGTAYHILADYSPSEAWRVWYKAEEVPQEIEDAKKRRDTIIGKIMDYLQKIIALLGELKSI